ncbi:hypothetical protein ACFL2J_08100, partial [Candidatus Omnitrophota bacterium]
MAGLFKSLSLVNRGLKYKLRVAFSLMSVIPLLACLYLFFIYNPQISKVPFSSLQIFLSIFVCSVIAVAGFLVAKQTIDPILEISLEAKNIAKGEVGKA